MFGGFKASKLKAELKMSVYRIQMASNKKGALLKQNKREIAEMLNEDPPREEKARIRAEALARDDNVVEALEIMALECELLYERIKLIEHSKTCPEDLRSVISTLIWAAHRVDVPELLDVRKQFQTKYGKKFVEDALNNVGGILNERVVAKLSVQPPSAYLVQTYLEQICDQHEVDWTPRVRLSTNELIEPMAAPIGYSVQVAQGSGLGASIQSIHSASVNTTGTIVTGLSECDIPVAPSHATKADGGDIPPPIVTAHAYVPQEHKNDVFDEIDIFVPGAPSAPPGNALSPLTHEVNGSNNKGDDSQPPPPVAPSGGSGINQSYEDMAARFSRLNK